MRADRASKGQKAPPERSSLKPPGEILPEDSERIEALRTAVLDGQYRVPATEVAEGMILELKRIGLK